MDGLKLDLSGQLSTSSAKSGKVNLQIRKPLFTARILLDALNGPHCSGDIVLSKNGAMLGGEAKYDVSSGRITKYSCGVGYAGKDYTASVVGTNAMQTFVVSYYHKVKQTAEIASKFTIDAKNGASSTLEVGTKYRLDSDSFLKAKMNSKGIAAFGYSQSVRKGVCLGLGLSLDTLKLQEPSHQVFSLFILIPLLIRSRLEFPLRLRHNFFAFRTPLAVEYGLSMWKIGNLRYIVYYYNIFWSTVTVLALNSWYSNFQRTSI